MGLYFLIQGYFLNSKKKSIYGHCICLPAKETFLLSWKVRLYRKSLHFLNAHDSCTVSMFNEKLRDDLIKDTNNTTDNLRSIKNHRF